jgi:hypothetical protein
MEFLTPYAALFALAAVVPLAALAATQRRADAVRRVLGVRAPSRRALLPVVLALVLLPCLVAVAAAQPVVVREASVKERADAQAFIVFDTSLSMHATQGAGEPDRLERAKRLALRLQAALPDVPMGVASMTDRALPNLMPTTDRTLFDRTVMQSVAVDRPPPSQPHPQARATTFEALVPLVQSQYYSRYVQRRLLVVFTDGESTRISPVFRLTLQRRVTPVFVHVWDAQEKIFGAHGKRDTHYTTDPTSTAALADLASVTGGRAFSETDFSKIVRASRNAVGHAEAHTVVSAYARQPLAPWFVLAAVVPLAFLLWRRNL